MHRRTQGRKRLFLSIAAALILFWIAGLFAFLRALPEHVDDTSTATDAIVVLTGGSLRLQTGLTLLQEGRAKRLFVSGVHRGVDVQQLLRLARQSPDAAECCISLGHEADDTAGNAAETSAWMAKHGYRSMRLVTAAYHMPRSLIEFHHAMPDVRIITHPVYPAQVKLDAWWRWPGTAGLIFDEYSKYLIARIRHLVGRTID
ncbi:MAG: YdcF family protein [Alphaproteobacteria bacterium]